MTEKELAFCEAYARSHNAEQSALDAGYSPTNARKNAWQILNRPYVQEYLNVLAEKARESAAIEVADVIKSLAAIAFASPVDYIERDESGLYRRKPPEALTPEQRLAVKEIRVRASKTDTEPDQFDYVLHDKLKALTMLGRHLGVFDHATASTPNPFMNLPQDQLEEISRAMEAALGGEDGSIHTGEGV
jgi:phage terminase small subunit